MGRSVSIPDLLNPYDCEVLPLPPSPPPPPPPPPSPRRTMSVQRLLNPSPNLDLGERQFYKAQPTDLPGSSPSGPAGRRIPISQLCLEHGQAASDPAKPGAEHSQCPLSLLLLTQPWSPTVSASPSTTVQLSTASIAPSDAEATSLPTHATNDEIEPNERHDPPGGTVRKGAIDQGQKTLFHLILSTAQGPLLVPVERADSPKSQYEIKRRSALASARYRARKRMREAQAGHTTARSTNGSIGISRTTSTTGSVEPNNEAFTVGRSRL